MGAAHAESLGEAGAWPQLPKPWDAWRGVAGEARCLSASWFLPLPLSVDRLSPRLALSLLLPHSLSVPFPDSPGPHPQTGTDHLLGPWPPCRGHRVLLDTSQGITVFIPTVQIKKLRLGTIR